MTQQLSKNQFNKAYLLIAVRFLANIIEACKTL